MQPEQQDVGIRLDASTVVRFLAMNPDFFNQHADVLPRLRIPHHTGAAVSLVEKQVSVLRSKCTTLENNLRDLIAVARANEQLHQRLHQLIQDIISATTLGEVVELTRKNLLANFNADDIRVVLVGSDDSDRSNTERCTASIDCIDAGNNTGYRIISPDDSSLLLFEDVFKRGETVCGEPNKPQLMSLFGESVEHIGSAATVPLIHNRKLGLVVLTSQDEARFASGKGVMFLNQLGEVLSRRVQTLL